MEHKTLQLVTLDIANALVMEMRDHQAIPMSGSISIVDILLQKLAKNIVELLTEANSSEETSDEDLRPQLRKAQRRLKKLARAGQDDDDELTGTGSSFPNLKYAKPKYKNVDTLLKYVEQDADTGGIKLVIMNFND